MGALAPTAMKPAGQSLRYTLHTYIHTHTHIFTHPPTPKLHSLSPEPGILKSPFLPSLAFDLLPDPALRLAGEPHGSAISPRQPFATLFLCSGDGCIRRSPAWETSESPSQLPPDGVEIDILG